MRISLPRFITLLHGAKPLSPYPTVQSLYHLIPQCEALVIIFHGGMVYLRRTMYLKAVSGVLAGAVASGVWSGTTTHITPILQWECRNQLVASGTRLQDRLRVYLQW